MVALGARGSCLLLPRRCYGEGVGATLVSANDRRRQARVHGSQGDPWHLNYQWKGRGYRFSLDRHVGRHIESKTEAEDLAERIRVDIRAGTFGPTPVPELPAGPVVAEDSFEIVGEIFIKSRKAGGKTSWNDDASMLRQIVGFTPPEPHATRLGEKPVSTVTEEDLEALLLHLSAAGRTVATVNHYVGLLRTLSRWLVRKKYRAAPLLTGDSNVIKKRKARKRSRRLEPEEEAKLLAAAGPHLQRVIICSLETCCRAGEILSLQWREVSLARREIVLSAEKTKTKTDRIIPISARLRAVLEIIRNDPAGKPFGPSAYVFGDETGKRIKSVKRSWQTAVLKAHGRTPMWIWTKGKARKASGKLSPESRAAYQAIDLHLHDLRHESRSRLLEAGWPLHEVQQMLGHANIDQTSTYLNAILRGLHRSMRTLDRARGATARSRKAKSIPACNPLASKPTCALLAARKDVPASEAKLLVNWQKGWRALQDSNLRPPGS